MAYYHPVAKGMLPIISVGPHPVHENWVELTQPFAVSSRGGQTVMIVYSKARLSALSSVLLLCHSALFKATPQVAVKESQPLVSPIDLVLRLDHFDLAFDAMCCPRPLVGICFRLFVLI